MARARVCRLSTPAPALGQTSLAAGCRPGTSAPCLASRVWARARARGRDRARGRGGARARLVGLGLEALEVLGALEETAEMADSVETADSVEMADLVATEASAAGGEDLVGTVEAEEEAEEAGRVRWVALEGSEVLEETGLTPTAHGMGPTAVEGGGRGRAMKGRKGRVERGRMEGGRGPGGRGRRSRSLWWGPGGGPWPSG